MTQGLAGLYKGYMIHVLLEGVGRGWYMMTYETMKRRLFPQFAEAEILKKYPAREFVCSAALGHSLLRIFARRSILAECVL